MVPVVRRARELAERTPPARDRVLDLLRAVAIVAVVLGHWLVTVIGYDQAGQLTGRSALPDLRWAHPLTWLVQVMPLFFLVGGYANATSLVSTRRRGGRAGDWLVRRSGRLVRPTTALVLTLAAGALVARLAGADPVLVRTAIWFAAIPLWFLAVYLLVVALTPVTYALHRRFGAAVPLVLVTLVGLGDLARLFGDPVWATGGHLFGWLAIHQAGFFWHEGRLPTRPATAPPFLVGGVGVLLALTVAGPYPVSMINVPGERLHNMSPPSLALLALFATQLGVVLLVRGRVDRWLRRPRPWRAVVAVNAVVLTVFLWHVTAALLVIGALHGTGLLPTPTVASVAWWGWRLPWLLVLGATLAGLGFVAVVAGLVQQSLLPRTEPAWFGFPALGLAAYLAGAALLRALRRTPEGPR